MRINRLFCASALILFTCLGLENIAFSETPQEAGAALIRQGIELTGLSRSGPYHVHNRLNVTDGFTGKKIEGHEDIYFVSSQRWRRELRLDGYYSESAFILAQKLYRVRRPNFTPPAARKDIAASVRALPEEAGHQVTRVFERAVDGKKVNCVAVSHGHSSVVDWCFDATSHLPIVEFFDDYAYRIEFSDYQRFGEKYVAGTVEVFSRGKAVGKSTLETVEAAIPGDPALFTPPHGAEDLPWCDDIQSVQLISGSRPEIPQGMRAHQGLQLVYEVTVDPRGNVSNVVPMEEKPFADRIVMETLAHWKYKPASCGSTPVPTDTILSLQN